MTQLSYQQRRGQIETYFDRTAVQAWARLTSDAPVSRIRATVRAGRGRKVKTALLTTFYGQLADLLRSGVPLLRALEVLRKQASQPALVEVLEGEDA